MEYLLVLLALICLAAKGVCGKKVGLFTRHTGDAFLFNLLRMALCLIIGFLLVVFAGEMEFLSVEWRMLLICLLSGAANAAFLVGWLLAVGKNAMVTVDVSLTVGSLIPAVFCMILFREAISPLKLLGFGLILIATAILAGYNKQTVGSPGFLGVLFVVITALGDGLTGVAQQLYKHCYTEGGSLFGGTAYPQSVFHFYTYVFAAVILLLLWGGYMLVTRRKRGSDEKGSELKHVVRPLPLIAIMAVCLFAASWCQTTATGFYGMPSQIMYPMIKGGCLITVNITAWLFFGEKITVKSVIGSLVALGGIVAINIL